MNEEDRRQKTEVRRQKTKDRNGGNNIRKNIFNLKGLGGQL